MKGIDWALFAMTALDRRERPTDDAGEPGGKHRPEHPGWLFRPNMGTPPREDGTR